MAICCDCDFASFLDAPGRPQRLNLGELESKELLFVLLFVTVAEDEDPPMRA